jgi:hypothetical protein
MKKRKPFCYKPNPPRPTYPIGRCVLLAALADEFERGASISKLYVALLARALLEQDPTLGQKYPSMVRSITDDALSDLGQS